MDYKSWIRQIDENFTKDPSWKMEVYRISLYLSDLCWVDTSLILEKRIFSLADQLYRSVGSISANIIEGYSRFSNKEKARFYEIALGSAREAKDWYFKSRHILGEEVYQNFDINYKITERNDSRSKKSSKMISFLLSVISYHQAPPKL